MVDEQIDAPVEAPVETSETAFEGEVIEAPTYEEIVMLLKENYGHALSFTESTKKNIQAINEKRRIFVKAERKYIFEVCKYLHDKLNFEQATSVCGVDYGDHFHVVYHLTNYMNAIVIEIVVNVPYDDPHIDSVAPIWGGANWHERETYELFGIIFDGHPKLERLLTPKSYEFFPFRKSYKLRGSE